ncbi:hypothetical protein C2S53_002384 [Perilla frutescens var. hirtella]|uniref:Uncharacterized protein n=1 Tax=Perilla frutescens var. hirtella TaxID=608512 RepID=A0AAD4JG85_PERFH|nr:hypothetical protein C2S53_002384 [Perilla frutescens var. hirtella]
MVVWGVLSCVLNYGKDGVMADCVEVHCCFTFAIEKHFLENDIRVRPDLDALSELGDVGWYCTSVGVILACSAFLQWEDGKIATFHCSFLANLIMDLTVVGTNGTLKFQDFVIPFEEHKASFSTAV